MLAVLLGLLSQAAEAPRVLNEDPPPAVCERPACRTVPTFKLRGQDGVETTVQVDRKMAFVTAEQKVMLTPGEYAVVRLGGPGEPPLVVIESGRAADLPRTQLAQHAEGEAQREIAQQQAKADTHPGAAPKVLPPNFFSTAQIKGSADLPQFPALPKGAVRVSFRQVAGSSVMLLELDSGYERKLHYQAYELLTDGRRKKTDVCDVPTGKFSFENWPEPIVEIELSDFSLIDDDGTETCQ
jgi:hypothetical protein